MHLTGQLLKMRALWTTESAPVEYHLRLDDKDAPLNPLVGSTLHLHFTGKISCIHCHRPLKKTFAQGYCFPCFNSLAETDACIVSPHLCHHHLGTCRDNDFAEKQCFIPHTVYLANSSGAKVGITRSFQKHTRWADQGAIEAIELAEVPSRKHAGDLELILSKHIPDKTNWRKMLSSSVESVDLVSLRQNLLQHVPQTFHKFLVQLPSVKLQYPVQAFPSKINSIDLDKSPVFSEKLMGIKGQYLIFETKVINLRKYQGYEISCSA